MRYYRVMSNAVLYLPRFKHESLKEVKDALGSSVPSDEWEVIERPTELLKTANTTLIVTDGLHRFGDSADRISNLVLKLLKDTKREIYIPGVLDLRRNSPHFSSYLELVTLLASTKTAIKSKRIKEALYIKRTLTGSVRYGSITPEIKEAVIEEFKRCQSIRQTARNLKTQGVQVSPSSVSRIIKTRRRRNE